MSESSWCGCLLYHLNNTTFTIVLGRWFGEMNNQKRTRTTYTSPHVLELYIHQSDFWVHHIAGLESSMNTNYEYDTPYWEAACDV